MVELGAVMFYTVRLSPFYDAVTTTVFPCFFKSSIRAREATCWAIIPPTKTKSAQAMSSVLSSSTLQSRSRQSQLSGKSAATVMSPKGVAGYFAPLSSQVAR